MSRDDEAVVKERIMAFARERFLQEGFSRITIEELTGQLGISKKTFYKQFRDKEDLVTLVAESIVRGVQANLGAIIAGPTPFIEKLRAVLELLGTTVSRFSPAFIQDLRRHSPRVWKRVEAFRREVMATNVGMLMAQGAREGQIRPQVDQRVLLMAYIGAIDTVIRPAVLAEESFSAHQALQSIVAIFFHGILTEEASRSLQTLQRQTNSHPL